MCVLWLGLGPLLSRWKGWVHGRARGKRCGAVRVPPLELLVALLVLLQATPAPGLRKLFPASMIGVRVLAVKPAAALLAHRVNTVCCAGGLFDNSAHNCRSRSRPLAMGLQPSTLCILRSPPPLLAPRPVMMRWTCCRA